jgi:hypothetical protein
VTDPVHLGPGYRLGHQQRQSFESRAERDEHVEQQRRDHIAEARDYYAGTQYDDDNADCARELTQANVRGEKAIVRYLIDAYQLPEHLRRHAYSTQIAECVDYLADRLAEGFAVDASPEPVASIIDACLDATPELSAGDADEQRAVATVLTETVKCGDVPVLIRWDATGTRCRLEFWDSEQVRLDFVDGRPDAVEKVSVTQTDWRTVDGTLRQVQLRRDWVITPADDPGGRRCVERVFITDQGEERARQVAEEIEWNLPVLPWHVLRAHRPRLRDTRGTSMVTEQAMRTADRYNAVEQVSWLVARYNSHGNLAVVGDQPHLMAQEGTRIQRDVADVLTFPGGTGVFPITLPTEPAMIEHQRHVLLDALYGAFSLTRTDQQTVSNLGQVSGYALEILNERTEGTFARVRSQLVRDFKQLLSLVVDVATYRATGWAPGAEVALPTDRSISVRLGSGWVVDEAQTRDDFVAGLISRRHALRARGLGDDEIDRVLDEIAEEAQRFGDRRGETGTFTASTQAGRLLGDATRDGNGAPTGGAAVGTRP